MAKEDWIVTNELDEETGHIVEVLTARPGSDAEKFVEMLEEIKLRNASKPYLRRTRRGLQSSD